MTCSTVKAFSTRNWPQMSLKKENKQGRAESEGVVLV